MSFLKIVAHHNIENDQEIKAEIDSKLKLQWAMGKWGLFIKSPSENLLCIVKIFCHIIECILIKTKVKWRNASTWVNYVTKNKRQK